MSWTASSGATSYDVYRSTTNGSGYTELQPPTTTTGYTDTTVTNGTTYYYVITAVNNSGQSAYSGQVSATPTSGGGGGSRNYGSIMSWGDSITVGADGSNSGPTVVSCWRISIRRPIPTANQTRSQRKSTLTTVGTCEQNDFTLYQFHFGAHRVIPILTAITKDIPVRSSPICITLPPAADSFPRHSPMAICPITFI